MKKEKVYFHNSKKQKLCGVLYLPDKEVSFPVVILCHGLSTSKESRNTTMTYPDMIKNGIAVFAERKGVLDREYVNKIIRDVVETRTEAKDVLKELETKIDHETLTRLFFERSLHF